MDKAPLVRLTLGIFSFIRTPLFTGKTNQSHFIFPLLEAESVAEEIFKTLYSGYGRTIYMPGIMPFLAVFVTKHSELLQAVISMLTSET